MWKVEQDTKQDILSRINVNKYLGKYYVKDIKRILKLWLKQFYLIKRWIFF